MNLGVWEKMKKWNGQKVITRHALGYAWHVKRGFQKSTVLLIIGGLNHIPNVVIPTLEISLLS